MTFAIIMHDWVTHVYTPRAFISWCLNLMSQIYQIKNLINHVKYTPMMEYDSVQRWAYMQITIHGQNSWHESKCTVIFGRMQSECFSFRFIYKNSIKINEPLQLMLVLEDTFCCCIFLIVLWMKITVTLKVTTNDNNNNNKIIIYIAISFAIDA